ncbi:peptide MFS transporter [Flavobacterium luminosum]|uniref:Peptide MFS transporter n=1 Tax=Flavobacterium luminosum TaxID=2949086 RepID=A0ABT0TPA3_9FLAO|nr:peptide MFS transporter [Flavobacterium sp. HXWNR70]MCL9809322.1 peptide MFS transporter [Flavobacterium sp. HXWNR70]
MAITIEEIQGFKGKYPKQLWYLFFSEMWERFCFYGMRGMLTYFMVYHLMMDSKQANLQYGATQAFVYAFTFIGGLFADKILGFRKSLFWGGLLMILGSVLLAINPKEFFFLGISFNIIGTGFFKPNISSMVGMLYKEGDVRRDAGFLLFYSGINLGAFLGGYVVAVGKGTLFGSFVPQEYTWNFAFGLAAVAMTISLLTFLFTRKKLATIGLSPLEINDQGNSKKWIEYSVYIGTFAIIPLIMIMVSNTDYTNYFMYAIGPFSLLYLFYEMTKNTVAENKKLIAALFFILFSVVFWAIFEQAGGSLSLFAAENLSDKLLWFSADPNAVNNSVNSFFVIVFAPIIGILFIALSKRKLEPNSMVKFGLGFLLLGIAFYLFYTIRLTASQEGLGSLNIFAVAYLVVTFAELFLSPIGLSLMTKLSPYRLQGLMMGMWFLASAYGQYVAGLFGASITPEDTDSKMQKMITYTEGYKDFALYAIISGIILIAIAPLIKKLMQEVK